MGLPGSVQGHHSNVQTLSSDLLQALNEISRSGRISEEAHGHWRLLAQLFPISWATPAPTHQRERSEGSQAIWRQWDLEVIYRFHY